jgi:hypothetical protein
VPVSEKMEVLDKAGKPVPHVYCIGDANGAQSPDSLSLQAPADCPAGGKSPTGEFHRPLLPHLGD